MSLQDGRSREPLHRRQCRVWQALEAARAAVAQAAASRQDSNDREKMQLLGSETRLGIPTGEGLWAAVWAKRLLEVPIWETRCRKARLQVYWDRVEGRGRWSVDTLQWGLHRRILLQHQSDWDGGWLQFRAQEEAAKLWGREGGRGSRCT